MTRMTGATPETTTELHRYTRARVSRAPLDPPHSIDSPMISAKEALDLYESSDAAAKQHLDKIESDIRQAAMSGKREHICIGKKLTETVAADATDVVPNPLQAKIIAELKKAKFRTEWVKAGDPIPVKGGGPDELQVIWAIKVSW